LTATQSSQSPPRLQTTLAASHLTITAPKAKDNCDKDITGTAVLPSTFGLGDTTITWKFVDAATNSSQCTQHITVSDKSAPVIDCSKIIQPITAEITDNACRIALSLTAPKAKDNCDKDIVGTAVLPSTFGLGDTTIIWKFVMQPRTAANALSK
jgi:hypothetical protein